MGIPNEHLSLKRFAVGMAQGGPRRQRFGIRFYYMLKQLDFALQLFQLGCGPLESKRAFWRTRRRRFPVHEVTGEKAASVLAWGDGLL
jgi:hypothetical protein